MGVGDNADSSEYDHSGTDTTARPNVHRLNQTSNKAIVLYLMLKQDIIVIY